MKPKTSVHYLQVKARLREALMNAKSDKRMRSIAWRMVVVSRWLRAQNIKAGHIDESAPQIEMPTLSTIKDARIVMICKRASESK